MLVLAGLIGTAAAVVPLLYRTGWTDVFTAPKLNALWAVLGVCLLLACLVTVVHGPGVLAMPGSRAADAAFAGWLLTNLLAFAWSVDRHQSLFGERYWYRGLLTVLLEGGFFLIARIGFSRVQQLWWLVAGIAIGGTAVALVGVLQAAGDGSRLRDGAPERPRVRHHRPAGLAGRLSRDRDRDDRPRSSPVLDERYGSRPD